MAVANETVTKSEIDAARATLSDASDLRAKATEASAAARKAISDAKEAADGLNGSIANVSDVIQRASSFDQQWNAFKKLFDDLNKSFVDKMKGQLSGASASKRPAEMTSVERVAQVLSRANKLVVLTGAGISAESGIPTFRGADGFWTVGSENYRPQELATWEKFDEMPEELWRWYQYRWGICTKAKPNAGHYALVELEKLVRGDFTLATQNIDGLHLNAGSDRKRLYEIHGRIDEMRCDERIEGACTHGLNFNDEENFSKVKATIVKTPKPAQNEKEEPLPHCQVCGVRQRPKILWFDESYNEAIYGYRSVNNAMEECDVLLIIGTQLTTGLPRSMVNTARTKGATIIKMDTEVDLEDDSSAGMLHLKAKSGEALPEIITEIKRLHQEPALAPLLELPKGPNAVLELPAHLTSKGALSTAAQASTSQPLQGPPALSLRRNPVVAKAAASSGRAKSTSALVRKGKNSMSGKCLPNSAPGTPPQGSGSRNAPQTRGSGTLKAAGSASLRNESAVNATFSKVNATAEGFFVYGTLRPDDNSGASWTKSFCEGMDSEVAFLTGASLYCDGRFPAVCLEQTRCSVRGAFLEPTSQSMFDEKLQEADRIEGYPDLYDRVIATVRTASGATRRAYLYHRTGRTDRSQCTRILDGDWLSRKQE